MANLKDIQRLIQRYNDGTATPEERRQVEQWYDTIHGPDHGNLEHQPEARAYVRRTLWAGIQRRRPVGAGKRRLVRWLPYAAAVLIAVLAGTWFFVSEREAHPQVVAENAYAIHPGGNRATLMLADGRTIDLSEAQSGIVVADGITYSDGTAVLDRSANTGTGNELLQLTTPRGGTYQITLPDGSQVWLNSGTTLKYPARFDGRERLVELEGEAYFEVKSLQHMPFKVKSKGQEVSVLGTQFNICAYPEDTDTKTTLVDGSVKVAVYTGQQPAVVLQPGQQSVFQQSQLAVVAVDTAPFIAWKSGFFHFRQTEIREVMNQLSRWYNIDVRYEASLPGETFSGKMERNVSLGNVLDFLSGSGIKYRLEGRHLIIEGLTYQ
ncbi:iron dicitrate transporter FecR [Parapedobacter defluvii]|uniref:Iron dicitrate transporter FecR n=2 Tax=Parapedobacter defluvii TaxID=2045106 RepID=A0ABQ1MN24_9SPHI|nr:FecR family protein [Parapedobacter defluvii]GGC43440.1 iron dicitrate transporter FecR [Parapedobacter defluvii]